MNASVATPPAGTLFAVGISDMKVSTVREEILITYSLGSCVGLTLYDPLACVGGMIHCLLPQSTIDPEKSRLQPCMFVDTGVTLLMESLFRVGAQKRRLIAKAAGGANVLDDRGLFRIGERNVTILRRILWKNEILLAGEDLGGTKARTLSLEMASGRTKIRSLGEQVFL